MNKDFLKTIFHADVGHVYEYIGSIPDGLDPESPEMSAHVTEDFVKGHGDNLISTMVVQLPFHNNKIILYCNSMADINTSDEFVLLTSLVPDVIPEVVVVEETTSEETTSEESASEQTASEQTASEETPTEGEGQ